MIHPDAVVELAFENPRENPVWVDVTEYVRGWSFSRGRQSELDRVEAGTATVRLHNQDGRFNPAKTDGPYYPNVRPMRRLRISALIDTSATPFGVRRSRLREGHSLRGGVLKIPLFTGFVERWPQAWPEGGFDAIVEIQAADAFKVFALDDFVFGERYLNDGLDPEDWVYGTPSGTNVAPDNGPPFVPDDLSGARVNRVLDAFGWPASDRDVDAGAVTILGSAQVFAGTENIPVRTRGLTYLQDIAATEGGFVFVAADGRVTFRDSTWDPPLDPVVDIYGDAVGENPYRNIADAPFGDEDIVNHVTVTTPRTDVVADAVAEDTTSDDRYYGRSETFTILPGVQGGSAVNDDRASELIARYAEPKLRIVGLEPMPETPEQWRRVVSKGLFEKIRARRRPVSGELIEQDSRVEGIAMDAPDQGSWTIAWNVSAL